MKKKIIVIGMCIVMAVSMTACGKGSKASSGNVGKTSDYTKADMKGTSYKSSVELAQYKGLKVGESTNTATDEEVESGIQNILKSNATDEKVESGTVQDGDKVNIDYTGKIDGAEFTGGSAKGSDLTIGSNTFIDGFESGLIGKNIGDSVDLNLKFPDDYKDNNGNPIEGVTGKDVVFTVKINYVTKTNIPELTEDFVKEHKDMYDADTIEEFKKKVKEELIQYKKLSAVLQNLFDSSKVTYDDAEVADLVAKQKQQILDQYEQYGLTLEQLLKNQNMTEDQFNAQLEDSVKQSLSKKVIAMKIARNENLKITDKEYHKEVDPVVEDYSYDSLEAFQKEYPKQDVVDQLLYYKVLQWIADNCEVVPDSEIETTTTAAAETTAETQETTAAQ